MPFRAPRYPVRGRLLKGKAVTEDVFYYDRKKLFFYLLEMLCVFAAGAFAAVLIYPEMPRAAVFLMILPAAAVLGAFVVWIRPFRVLWVTDEAIRIDSGALMKWADIVRAREYSPFLSSKRVIIALTPGDGVSYRLRLMQKICRLTGFPVFSIPLYAMRDEDADRAREIVAAHVPLEKDGE